MKWAGLGMIKEAKDRNLLKSVKTDGTEGLALFILSVTAGQGFVTVSHNIYY